MQPNISKKHPCSLGLGGALPDNRKAIRKARNEFESDAEQFNLYVYLPEDLDISNNQEDALESANATSHELAKESRDFLTDPGDAGNDFFNWRPDTDEFMEDVDEVLEEITEDNGFKLF